MKDTLCPNGGGTSIFMPSCANAPINRMITTRTGKSMSYKMRPGLHNCVLLTDWTIYKRVHSEACALTGRMDGGHSVHWCDQFRRRRCNKTQNGCYHPFMSLGFKWNISLLLHLFLGRTEKHGGRQHCPNEALMRLRSFCFVRDGAVIREERDGVAFAYFNGL